MATYYVNGSGGVYVGTQGTYAAGLDDAGSDGSLAEPWLTLNYAESRASAGDTIYIAAATYMSAAATRWTSTKGITWTADGTVIVQTPDGQTSAAWMTGASVAVYNGITFDGRGPAGGLLRVVQFASDATTKTFNNCTFSEPKDAGHFVDNGKVAGATNVFNNCTFTSTSAAGLADVFQTYVNGFTITGCTFNVAKAVYFFNCYNTNAVGLIFTGNNVTAQITEIFAYVKGGIYSFTNNTMVISGAINNFINSFNDTGTFTFTGNDVEFSGINESYLFQFLTGTWTINISNNINIEMSNAGARYGVINIADQADPVISLNTIDTSASTNSCFHVYIQSTGTDCGAPSITNNTCLSKSTSGYVIGCGSEATSAGDNLIVPTITGNKIYGPKYYDPAVAGATTHSIFVGFDINATIQKNLVYGGPYGVVLKHGGEAYTDGGVKQNVFINCASVGAILLKGVQDVDVWGNSGYFTSTFSCYFISANENGVGEFSTGHDIQNNVCSGNVEFVGTETANCTITTCNKNCWYAPTPASGNFHISGVNKTWAEWQTAGYDADSINTNPQYSSTSNLQLTPASPYQVRTGGANLGFTTDFDGKSLPFAGGYPMGAYRSPAMGGGSGLSPGLGLSGGNRPPWWNRRRR